MHMAISGIREPMCAYRTAISESAFQIVSSVTELYMDPYNAPVDQVIVSTYLLVRREFKNPDAN